MVMQNGKIVEEGPVDEVLTNPKTAYTERLVSAAFEVALIAYAGDLLWQDNPKITFIGAGSTVFMKNIVGDVLQRPALAGATIALMDINPQRLEESAIVASKLISTLGVPATVETYSDQRKALDGADFVVVAFQIGGYEPCTVTDFEVPKKYGLRQTIADTLGIGGIMRGLRTVPHLWKICEDMLAVCPEAIMLQYVNPMAINTWAIAEKYPDDQAGRPLPFGAGHRDGTGPRPRHSLRGNPLPRRPASTTWRSTSSSSIASRTAPTATSIPISCAPTARAARPSPAWNPRCPNKVRYEMLTRLGYFVTESSEHFAEYTPYFIKEGREDLIEKFGIPLDEYPKRCIEQIERWKDAGRGLPHGRHDRGQAVEGIRLLDHELGVDRRAVGDLRQRPQQRLHHLAARQLRGRSAVPRRCVTASSRPSSATCRRS